VGQRTRENGYHWGLIFVCAVVAACAGKARERGRDDPSPEAGAAGEASGHGGQGGEPEPGGAGRAAGGSDAVGGSGAGPGSGTGGGSAAGGSGASGGSGAMGGSGVAGAGGLVCGGVVCDALPNVRDGAVVECRDDRCVIPPDGCEASFADCALNTADGCETDLSDEASCGACDVACDAASPICTRVDGEWACGTACIPATPTFCGRCVDLNDDARACGSCDNDCTRAHAPVACVEGSCVITSSECDTGYADCTDAFGCESSLAENPSCGACGRDCSLSHTLSDCSSADACGAPSCEPGFANCDLASADCETPFGQGCAPVLSGITSLPGAVVRAAAYAGDGSYAIAGAFFGATDLDPGTAVDEHVAPLGQAAFVSWYSASGEYLASISFGADVQANVDELAATDDGGFVMLGIDDGGKFVAKLTAEREVAWAHHFHANANAYALAAAANGGAIVGGQLAGDADIDPGPGEAIVVNDRVVVDNGFVVVLDAQGAFVWGHAIADLMLESPCSVDVAALAGAPDGRVFVTGFAFAFCTLGGADFSGVYVNSYSASGSLIARALTSAPELQSATVRPDGSVELGGVLSFSTDFDPGPAVVERTNQDEMADGYLLRLTPGHDFERVNVFPHASPSLLAPFSDGATLAVIGADEVHGFETDGTDLFAFRAGSGFQAIAAHEQEFLLAGEALASADFDPGPEERLVPAGGFVARYRR
jgi:hypothetical protein